MVVLFFAIGKNNFTFSTREFRDYLTKGVLAPADQKRVVVPFELSSMRDLIMNSLDSLLKTNDELQRLDLEMESFLKSLEKRVLELQPDFEFTVNIKNNPYKVEEAINTFQWDEQKYPKNQKTIEQIMEKITEKFTSTKSNLKTKSDDYQSECEKLKQKMKSDSEAASFMKVDYREIVKRSTQLMVKTDYLTTLLCFVPLNMVENFQKGYIELVEGMVLPLSAEQLDSGEDEKTSLWRVVVMAHKKDEFINQARTKFRILAKEYDENEILRLPKELKEKEDLKKSIDEKRENLLNKNCKAFYSEMYHALLHIKFLRLYTESTLKYGTSEYYSCIVFTNPGKETKVVSQMIKTFSDTGDQGWYGTKEELKDTEDFYPFILVKLGVPTYI